MVPTLHGKTPIGRATVELLQINAPARIEHRRLLQKIRLARSKKQSPS